ncbi:cytochrome P450 [Xylariaceae sp. FL1651]|nr:cytochrome P450 [Xylariaceae sp. FL1651]
MLEFSLMCVIITGTASLGIVSHLALFIHGEWHMQAPILLQIYSAIGLAVFCALRSSGCANLESFIATILTAFSYAAGTLTSIVVYRTCFHRLRCFPGPWAARVTKFWHVWQCRSGQNYLVLERLRKQYGPVIRTGPDELTIIDPAVSYALDGPGNQCTKAVWYDFLLPEIAINTTRSKAQHDARRRIWDKGFTPARLTVYQERVAEYARTLVSRIEELAHQEAPVDLTDWFYWFTWDVMGEFAFARSFDMLKNEQWHFAPLLLRRAMRLLGPFSPVPWLAQIAFRIAPWMFIVRDWFAMLAWCRERMSERIQMNGEMPDISHLLIEASAKADSLEADRPWLNGDAIAIIIAGSDTIAPTLIFAVYELARKPEQQQKLFGELEGLDVHDSTELQSCEHLNAVINETLRLYPAVPTGGYRQTSSSGLHVGDLYLPGDVTIISPRYSLARLESAYEKPESWIPERWTTRRNMVKDSRAFAPFAHGRYNCVGKNLAMIEMRLVLAMLVRRFEMGFSPSGDEGEVMFKNMGDYFTAAPGRLELMFRKRQ